MAEHKYKQYATERDGQIDFFNQFGIPWQDGDVIIEHTDGIWNGNILEFKKNISDLNAVLFQAIKYLSAMRIRGCSHGGIPANILLVSLNDRKLYHFKSEDYFADIHKVYQGAASKNNSGFVAKKPVATYEYASTDDYTQATAVKKLLKSNDFMKIDLDENCIVGWAERYYKENPSATKADFLGDDDEAGAHKILGEIREPKHFKDYINAYEGKTNEKFKYLMDKLNEDLRKKDLGAFYTPLPYCELAAGLLDEAIARVPEGNDYIIIDRCAGTGNLESVLSDDILEHCILATYEYYEYKVLQERLGDKVRLIVPPLEEQVVYSNGYVMNADAMSKEFVEMSAIKEYIDDPNCTIIMYENPPYSEASSTEHQKKGTGKESSSWKTAYVPTEMKKAIKNDKTIDGRASNEKANAFIWSAFEYYLRQPTDSYVLFSPVKYWKYQRVINKTFVKGYVFNRRHFHATASAVACILWTNEDDTKTESIELPVYDIDDKKTSDSTDDELVDMKIKMTVKRTSSLLSAFYDKRKFDDDKKGIVCELNGAERLPGKSISFKNAIYNDNMLGYLITKKATFDQPRLSASLLRAGQYDGHGFYLRDDNYMEKLPLFAAAKYPIEDKWYENGTIYKSADGGTAFTQDEEFLNDCLIFTCLSYYNKCRSFTGSDKRLYKNELCFDDDTVASKKLEDIELSDEEQKLIDLYNKILEEAKKTANYNSDYTYGPYQIEQELDTSHEVMDGSKKKKVPDYPDLHGDLSSLKTLLKEYYLKNIAPKCFEYELLK